MSRRSQFGISMALVVLTWGMNYAMTKIGVERLAPVNFVFWRFLGTAAAMLPWMVKDRPRRWSDWGKLALMGLVGVSLYQWLFATALSLTTAADVAFLFNLSPLMTLAVQSVTGRRPVTRFMFWGAGIAVLGVLLLAHASLNGGWLGDLMALLAAMAWSAFTVMTDRFQLPVKGLAQTGWMAAVGSLGLLPFIRITEPWRLGFSTWGPLLYTILFVTVLGLSLWQRAVETEGAGRASLYLYVIPVVAALSGWLWLGEPIGWTEGLGALLILSGVIVGEGRVGFRRPPSRLKSL